MGFTGKRSYLEEPYHFCARCGTRYHLSQLKWQRGLLICFDTKENCFDTSDVGLPLTGDREMAVTRALQAAYDTGNQEMIPWSKLTDTEEIQASMDEDLIY